VETGERGVIRPSLRDSSVSRTIPSVEIETPGLLSNVSPGLKITAFNIGLRYCLQADARFMNGEHYRSHKGRRALALVCVVLIAVGAFMVVRSHSHRSGLMTLDPDGTMRLGTVPLRNTNVRDAALTVVGHLNNGTISFSSTGTVTLSNFGGTFQALQRAGITNVIIRTRGASATVGP
jgi:hypothetical protein